MGANYILNYNGREIESTEIIYLTRVGHDEERQQQDLIIIIIINLLLILIISRIIKLYIIIIISIIIIYNSPEEKKNEVKEQTRVWTFALTTRRPLGLFARRTQSQTTKSEDHYTLNNVERRNF